MSAGRIAAVGPVEELASRLDLRPLTGRYEAGAVIRAAVAGHAVPYGLSERAFPGGRRRVSHVALPLGTPVRARIRARAVALATTRPSGISFRNIFAARVTEIAPERAPIVDVRLDIGTPAQPVALWARVTARAAYELGLTPGREGFALVTTVALDPATYARSDPAPAHHAPLPSNPATAPPQPLTCQSL